MSLCMLLASVPAAGAADGAEGVGMILHAFGHILLLHAAGSLEDEIGLVGTDTFHLSAGDHCVVFALHFKEGELERTASRIDDKDLHLLFSFCRFRFYVLCKVVQNIVREKDYFSMGFPFFQVLCVKK